MNRRRKKHDPHPLQNSDRRECSPPQNGQSQADNAHTVPVVLSERTQRMELLIGRLLQAGVALSMFLLMAGFVVMLIRHPDYFTNHSTLRHLTDSGAAFPLSARDIIRELGEGRGRAIMTLGLIVLILTPVARVAASILTFAVDRDWRFVCITTIVLVVLLASFLLGKAG